MCLTQIVIKLLFAGNAFQCKERGGLCTEEFTILPDK